MFIVTLIIITLDCKQPKYRSTIECCIVTQGSYIAMRINYNCKQQSVLITYTKTSEKNRNQKVHYIWFHLYHILKHVNC